MFRDDGVAEAKGRSGNSRSISTKMRLNEQSIEACCLDTVVRGRIGEWIELGGVIQKRKGSEASIRKRTATHNDESRKVFLN